MAHSFGPAMRGGTAERLAWWGHRAGDAMLRSALAERARWTLWLPVAMGIGIAVYFMLPSEPGPRPGWLALALAVAAVVSGLACRRRWPALEVLAVAGFALGAAALGFGVARWAAAEAAAPVLTKRIGPVAVTGSVVAVEPGLKGPRVTLDSPTIGRLGRARTPSRVRLRLRADAPRLRIGDRVRLRAVLMPPPAPSAPGAFDFGRMAWFMGLGAVGYGFGPVTVMPATADGRTGLAGWMAAAHDDVNGVRTELHRRVVAALPGPAGGMAAALITGERGAIPPEEMEAMRAAGLAHLLAISGLHVGLVTGAVFFALRALLALWPALALGFPIKKWAAGAALVSGFGYMLVTGATVPTQRAFLMAGLVLLAVMVDRAAISMRLVAWAAAVVLVVAPESLTGPSFQMSFAAVIALVATYEAARGWFARLRGNGGMARAVPVYVFGVVLTTLVAGLATAPFAVYHFNRVALFGLAANLGAVPVTALWIMPWSVLAYLLMPFGLEGLALTPMGWGIEAVLAIARTVAAWPGAALPVPAMPDGALALIVFGGLWLCLWRTRWRLAGIAAIVLGVGLTAAARPPDILVAGDGQSFAVLDRGGELVLAGAAPSRFERETWFRRAGLDPDTAVADASPPSAGRPLACDDLACIYRARGHVVSFIRSPGAAAEDCPRADLVVALVPLIRMRCAGPRRVIGRFDLWREGAHAIWLENGGGVRLRTVAGLRGDRPWSPRRKPRRSRRAR